MNVIYFLRSDGTDPSWAAIGASDLPSTVVFGGGSGVAGRVPLFSDGRTLTSSADLTWDSTYKAIAVGGATSGSPVVGRAYFMVRGASGPGVFEVGSGATDADENQLGQIVFNDYQSSQTDKRGALILASLRGATANNRGAVLRFYTRQNNVANALEVMRISENGALFIGKTSGLTGAGDLDVNGNTRIGGNVGFYNTSPQSKPTVTGSRGGNAALTSLLTALANLGLITNSTS